jgi:hypothetical protein
VPQDRADQQRPIHHLSEHEIPRGQSSLICLVDSGRSPFDNVRQKARLLSD